MKRKQSSCQLQMLVLCWSEYEYFFCDFYRSQSTTSQIWDFQENELPPLSEWHTSWFYVKLSKRSSMNHGEFYLLFRKVTLLCQRLRIVFYLETWFKCYFYWVAMVKKNSPPPPAAATKLDKTHQILSFHLYERWTQCLFFLGILHAAFMVAQSFFPLELQNFK